VAGIYHQLGLKGIANIKMMTISEKNSPLLRGEFSGREKTKNRGLFMTELRGSTGKEAAKD